MCFTSAENGCLEWIYENHLTTKLRTYDMNRDNAVTHTWWTFRIKITWQQVASVNPRLRTTEE